MCVCQQKFFVWNEFWVFWCALFLLDPISMFQKPLIRIPMEIRYLFFAFCWSIFFIKNENKKKKTIFLGKVYSHNIFFLWLHRSEWRRRKTKKRKTQNLIVSVGLWRYRATNSFVLYASEHILFMFQCKMLNECKHFCCFCCNLQIALL